MILAAAVVALATIGGVTPTPLLAGGGGSPLLAAGENSPVTYGLFTVLGSILVYAVVMFTRTGTTQKETAQNLVNEAKEERDTARRERDAAREQVEEIRERMAVELEEQRERMQTDIDYWRERYLAEIQGGGTGT